jgi:uncharacterized protein
VSQVLVPAPVGTARITWYPARGSMRAVALLGHGSAIGIESPYLQALAGALPSRGITGGRSAGAQVACRTAAGVGAHAVLPLAYPRPSGRAPRPNCSPAAARPWSCKAETTPQAALTSSRRSPTRSS